MDTENNMSANCPAEELLKSLSGKWKPQIFRLATSGAIRFSSLMRSLEGINKQSLTTALRELEDEDLLTRIVVKKKPLHIEYILSEKGKSMIPIFKQIEALTQQ
uniref:winged helix-turn-helix transcriptional regulator n=1 Tax=uncultured Dysgonomonas sp. TaxID=206096 RepID=UPI00260C349B|nr:helix-turn-helix domain-containing protein [uncultured Dysgonomonas sp.]